MLGLVIGFGVRSALAGQPELTAAQRELNIASFESIWSTVDEDYWDPTFGGVDWRAVHDELRPRLDQARTMEQVREVMRDMISRLGLSHFAIIPADVYLQPDLPEQEQYVNGEVGIEYRILDGHAVVTSVAPDSPAAQLGVRTGWENDR